LNADDALQGCGGRLRVELWATLFFAGQLASLCHLRFLPTLVALPDAGYASVSIVFWVPALKSSRPTVLTNLFRPMAPLQYARHPHARNPLAFSSGATIAESAVASFAGSTPPSKSVSMSLRASIPMASCTAHATVAMARSASGNTFVQAAPTARAPTTAQRLSRLRHPFRRSVQRILA
jgi:hypothetical protein